MPTSEILFDPNLDERALDKETDKVNQQLEGVGEDIPVNFEGEMPEMDGLSPAGAGGGGGIGGEAAAFGAGRSGLASKIPKPMAGVAASSVLPVGLAGAVGAGMVSAMMGASARLQTSTTILGQAWNNVWRPIGDKVDQLFIRDLALDLLSETQDLGEAIRTGDFLDGAFSVRDILFEGQSGNWLAAIVPGGLSIRLIEWFKNEITGVNWGELKNEVVDLWPGWPDVSGLWPGWPDVGELWPGWPDIDTEWPGWPDLGMPEWPSAGQILNQFPSLNAGTLRDAILGDFEGGDDGGDTGSDDGFWDGGVDWGDPDDVLAGVGLPSLQTGGRIQRSGVAQVHRGELVADPDRLVSELASAVSQASGGGQTRRMDTSGMERRLDQVVRRLQRLENAFDVTVEVDGETIARASANGKKNRVSDSNQLV